MELLNEESRALYVEYLNELVIEDVEGISSLKKQKMMKDIKNNIRNIIKGEC